MRYSLRLTPTIIACSAFLIGCQTAPTTPATQVSISMPPTGEALAYVFRPDLDNMGTSDKPIFLVDGSYVAILEHSTYTVVSLKPGMHQFQLAADKAESSTWNIKQDFNVDAGQTHFVAIWHQDQPKTNSNLGNAAGSAGAMHFGVVGAAIFGGLATATFGHHGSMESVVFESVEKDVGMYALAGLRLVDAKTSRDAPLR